MIAFKVVGPFDLFVAWLGFGQPTNTLTQSAQAREVNQLNHDQFNCLPFHFHCRPPSLALRNELYSTICQAQDFRPIRPGKPMARAIGFNIFF